MIGDEKMKDEEKVFVLIDSLQFNFEQIVNKIKSGKMKDFEIRDLEKVLRKFKKEISDLD